jgi:hypothetical protein
VFEEFIGYYSVIYSKYYYGVIGIPLKYILQLENYYSLATSYAAKIAID